VVAGKSKLLVQQRNCLLKPAKKSPEICNLPDLLHFDAGFAYGNVCWHLQNISGYTPQ